ncbi:MAG: UDP-N-acetylmuramate dehydrogenase [Proteobacteria bacterium]|nr:UDP-N-acetylmuramate dehydrogenase [Pseudomonadota bacterium]
MLQENPANNDSSLPLITGEQLAYALAPLTSWRIGGVAERFFSPIDIENLSDYLKRLPAHTPLTWLGLGSNVLIRDSGIKGAVICTKNCKQVYQQEDGSFFAQAGVTCAKFARFASKLGFPDAAFFAGIPGTIGGALAMNAGAFGGETWEWVELVTVINRQGHTYTRSLQDYSIAYRSVSPKHPAQLEEAFIGVVFRFPKSSLDGMDKIRELLRKRQQTQPIGTLNCGSVYRNPPGEFAAKLIEACQLKGYRIGDAQISEKHANFIINSGAACAHDVETLMSTIEAKVWDRFGIKLHAEVRILGQK